MTNVSRDGARPGWARLGPDKGSGVVGSAQLWGCQAVSCELGPHSRLVCPQHAWIVDEKKIPT